MNKTLLMRFFVFVKNTPEYAKGKVLMLEYENNTKASDSLFLERMQEAAIALFEGDGKISDFYTFYYSEDEYTPEMTRWISSDEVDFYSNNLQ